jgi:hypothetical protein
LLEERDRRDASPFVPLGVEVPEIRCDYVQLGLRLGQCNTRPEPAKDAQKMRVALQLLQIAERQRYPYIKLISSFEIRSLADKFELPWKHAHNCVADIV